MQKETSTISLWQRVRHWLRNCLTLLAEAFLWTGCAYLAGMMLRGFSVNAGHPYAWYVILGWCFVLLAVVSYFIPNNAYSRTARRDEVVAQAMKVALAVSVLSFVVFTERTSLQFLACIFFCIALAIGRLIINSWFVRYALRHGEHGVIICDEDSCWQQTALQQNTYGLSLVRLERQTAQLQEETTATLQEETMAKLLEAYLASHPETGSIYCAPSSLPPKEMEDIAHICRKQGLVLHVLPISPCSLPQTMQSGCRGTVGVLSPATPPLQRFSCRMVKRLADIVLSLVVLLTVFPLFALIAFICIKKQSRGPVLMSRHLCGMDGKAFRCLTFRTRHYEAAPSFFEGTGDPGYFPFGKFLTNSRLELLPQFLCVLWGSMTIVGSQAMRPEQYAEYRREARHLFASTGLLKVGITSYQFAGEEKGSTKADVWYTSNWGFWLDVRIMLQRLGTLLSKSKAKSINYI